MCECVLSRTAINYKALGLHVLIRGINVSSFPPHTPPFASINAAGERKSVRASSRRESERSCLVFHMQEDRAGRVVKNREEAEPVITFQLGKREVCYLTGSPSIIPVTQSTAIFPNLLL